MPLPTVSFATRFRVRTLVAACLAVATAACEPETAPPERVARVADRELSVERLADLLVLAQPLPLDTATAGALADQWMDVSAFAHHAGAGTDLAGGVAAEAALWLDRREALLEAERHARWGPAAPLSRQEARNAFEGDSLLLLAHVLKATTPGTSPQERDLQRRAAAAVVQRLRAGGSWEDAAAESEDLATRDRSGLLGLLRIDDLPPALQAPASTLQPGQISPVVESPAGFHVLYRPAFADVAEVYAVLLGDRERARRDGALAGTLADSLSVVLSSGAVSRMRALARGRTTDSVAAFATWEGGELEGGSVVRYLATLTPDDRRRLAASDDAALEAFVVELSVRQARLDNAASRGLEPADTAELSALHAEDVSWWRRTLEPFTAEAVDRYMERLVARQLEPRALSPLFRRWLLQSLEWQRDAAALKTAVERARDLLTAADEPG